MSLEADLWADNVIVAEGISKQHRLYQRPADRVKQWLARGHRHYFQEIWALRDVSFAITAGESLGIVGRNGSGKSSLLQILAGIAPPTGGQAMVRGRVAALLELGTGFSGEFSGRDNVMMTAAIMGLSREEIENKLDDIISFADIGPFIEHPVKTYSSGMYVRLAFALAISVNPDILIVDEALAVGDEVFQNRCYGRISEFQERGGTLLFVSHSPQMVTQFCQRAILLDEGELLCDGNPREVISEYRRMIHAPPGKGADIRQELLDRKLTKNMADTDPNGSDEDERLDLAENLEEGMVPSGRTEFLEQGAVIRNPRIETMAGEKVNVLVRGRRYAYCYDVDFAADVEDVAFQMIFRTHTGYALGGKRSGEPGKMIDKVAPGQHAKVRFEFECRIFPETHYTISCGVTADQNGETIFLHRIIDAVMFRVQPETKLWHQGIVDFSIDATWSFEPTAE